MFTPPENRVKGGTVNFMATCLCDSIFSDAAQCAVSLLKRYGAKVEFPKNQTCCGQPAFNSGDFASARKVIMHTIDVFSENDYPVIVPSASCAAMLFHSSKIAFREADKAMRDKVDAFANRVWELCDYLVNAMGVEKIEGSLKAKIAVHNSCHSKGTGTPDALKKLLSSIDGVELLDFENSDSCCGFGGTFSVVFPQISSELGLQKVKCISALKPDIICAADTSCLLHQKGIADKNGIAYPTQHAVQVFCKAIENGGKI